MEGSNTHKLLGSSSSTSVARKENNLVLSMPKAMVPYVGGAEQANIADLTRHVNFGTLEEWVDFQTNYPRRWNAIVREAAKMRRVAFNKIVKGCPVMFAMPKKREGLKVPG